MTHDALSWPPPSSDDRVWSLDAAIADAWRILAEARRIHFASHREVGMIIQFSGGNDSTILAHLMRHEATHFGHANTGIGIEQTRQFVRHWAAEWGLPLLEEHPNPGDDFESLVLERGFPGPAGRMRSWPSIARRTQTYPVTKSPTCST